MIPLRRLWLCEVHREAPLDSLVQILQEFFKRFPLSRATRQGRYFCPIATFFSFVNNNFQFHTFLRSAPFSGIGTSAQDRPLLLYSCSCTQSESASLSLSRYQGQNRPVLPDWSTQNVTDQTQRETPAYAQRSVVHSLSVARAAVARSDPLSTRLARLGASLLTNSGGGSVQWA